MRHAAIFLPGIITPAEIAYGDLRDHLEGSGTILLRDLAVYDRNASPGDYSLDYEIAAILEAADASGFDRFHLCGYSAGGAISASFAARYPDRLASLALMEPAWFGNEGMSDREIAVRDAIDEAMTLPPERSLPEFVRSNLDDGVEPPPPPPGDPPPWMRLRPAAIAALTPAFSRHRLDFDALRRFPRPVLYIRGALSNPHLYLEIQERAASIFPEFAVEIFENRHHFDPPHRAEPARTAALLKKFWERAESSSGA